MYGSHAGAVPWPFIFMGRHGPFDHRHGPPPWVLHMMGAAGRGAERGEIRYLILDALSDGPSHGYGIISTIERKSGGGYRPSPGSVYPTLQMLEEMGHVTATEPEGRKTYAITDEGRADLAEHSDEVEDTWDRLNSDTDWTEPFDLHAMGQRFGRMMRTIGRGVRQGRLGPEEMKAIGEAVEEAATRIEAILRSKRP